MDPLWIAYASLFLQGAQTIPLYRPYFRRRTVKPMSPGRSEKGIVLSRTRLALLLAPAFFAICTATYSAYISPSRYVSIPFNKLQQVNDKTFMNEEVSLDGKAFRNCTFINVKLRYEGHKNLEMVGNTFEGSRIIVTSSHPITNALMLGRALNMGNAPIIQEGDK